ncbi:MAG TPA: twin-arginine translocation signal domain-containing protein [Phototrophicaceae bacterium]|nr:twin-arginine translocation signal domain-containing protein [Phototrophicaceae bacterium]
MANKHQEFKSELLEQFKQGRVSRRNFLQMMAIAGAAAAGLNVLVAPAWAQDATETAEASTRPLTPTIYQWMIDLHPGITDINTAFGNVNQQIAPVAGFDTSKFVAEAKSQTSSYDLYLGATPFVDMAALVKTGAIEPWDPYIPADVLADILPAIREESTFQDKLYHWPFLLDIIVQAYDWNLVNAAGLPDTAPPDWDTFLSSAQTILDKGAARYGATFDAHGWRSLVPITHSISTDVYYTLDGDPNPGMLFDFTNPAVVQALQLMKKILDVSSANALQPGTTDGGVNNTPDEVAFAAEQVAYYIKYENAPLRMASTWQDPTALRLGALPKQTGGAGGTVFWNTGAVLFKYGQNKEKAAEYMKALTYNAQLWQDSIAGTAQAHPGQLPPYKSIYDGWAKDNPDWLQKQTWVPVVRAQLDNAKAIPNHAFGLQQFIIGEPLWEKYLTGDEPDPMKALQAAKDAVVAAIKQTS